MAEIEKTLLEEKLDKYGCDMHDYKAETELTVTITLSEYRQLVISVATAEGRIRVAEEGKWERNRRIEELKKENADLHRRIYELSSPLVTKCEDRLDV